MKHFDFQPEAVLRLVEHALGTPQHFPADHDLEDGSIYHGGSVIRLASGKPDYRAIDLGIVAPALMLIKDQGVYLMSNGLPILRDPDFPDDPDASLVVYADGCDPRDPAWVDRAGSLPRNVVEKVEISDEVMRNLKRATSAQRFRINIAEIRTAMAALAS